MSDVSEVWKYSVKVPVSGELLDDCRGLRDYVDELFKEWALDMTHGPRYGPPKPHKRHVWLPAGKPAGKYRSTRK